MGFFPNGVCSDGICPWQKANMFRQGVKKVGMKKETKIKRTFKKKFLSVAFIFKNVCCSFYFLFF